MVEIAGRSCLTIQPGGYHDQAKKHTKNQELIFSCLIAFIYFDP